MANTSSADVVNLKRASEPVNRRKLDYRHPRPNRRASKPRGRSLGWGFHSALALGAPWLMRLGLT